MNIVMISPGYPAEMAYFTRALAAVGATVIGLGDQPPSALPEPARHALAHYEQVTLDRRSGCAGRASRARPACLDRPDRVLVGAVHDPRRADPGVVRAAGHDGRETLPFRDKEHMKQRIDAAGIRTPWHVSATTVAGVWEAAERVGYPLIVKPIDGAGSADTYRVDSTQELAEVLPLLRHVPEVSVEEFIDGEEFTYDTVCANGSILFENVMWYRPRPLQMKMHEWISPTSIVLRDLSVPHLQGGRQMGGEVLPALGFRSGFTHMEWYRKADGEAVFGEIGGRPPGARVVDLMNYATDGDLYVAWAEAVVHGRLSQPLERKFNAGCVFKRAKGVGRITHIEGLDQLLAEYGEHVVLVDLLPVGAPRRDWRATLISDGLIVVRHPELQAVIEMTERFASDMHMYAG